MKNRTENLENIKLFRKKENTNDPTLLVDLKFRLQSTCQELSGSIKEKKTDFCFWAGNKLFFSRINILLPRNCFIPAISQAY